MLEAKFWTSHPVIQRAPKAVVKAQLQIFPLRPPTSLSGGAATPHFSEETACNVKDFHISSKESSAQDLKAVGAAAESTCHTKDFHVGPRELSAQELKAAGVTADLLDPFPQESSTPGLERAIDALPCPFKDDISQGTDPHKRIKIKSGEEPSVIRFGEAEYRNHGVSGSLLKPTREASKIMWPNDGDSSSVKNKSAIRSAAQALANARACAEEAMGSAWGRVLTSPTESKLKKFGHPIVWRSDVAYSYEPNGLASDSNGVPKVNPNEMLTDVMWSLVSDKFFQFTHFFEGTVPKQFASISEALDFHPRCGGKLRAELPSRRRILDAGARGNVTMPELLSALVTT